MNIDAVMRLAPVIPVLVLEQGGPDPVGLAETLVENGLSVIEVTLRTPGALEAMTRMAAVPGAVVGAGTGPAPHQLRRASDAGANFVAAPGLTERRGRGAIDSGVPFLPGVANASDIMRAMELGFDRFKFFPAEASGGLKAIKALAGPFGDARFCPTGGITLGTAPEWLAEEAVLCVGGSWIVPKGEQNSARIAALAKAASQLRYST